MADREEREGRRDKVLFYPNLRAAMATQPAGQTSDHASTRSGPILVTGATGKVGSHLVPRPLAQGLPVRALVRQGPNVQRLRELGADVVERDLLGAESLDSALKGMETVVHLAAFFRGATPEQSHEVNVVGTERLATAARRAGVKKFIFVSTGTVYPAGLDRPAQESGSRVEPLPPTIMPPPKWPLRRS
jgi:UDP-glucose 4-epimerase